MNDESDPMDLSALDPARVPERWAARLAATSSAVAAVLRTPARSGPLEVLSGWARPILAAAAVLLLFLGAAAGAMGPRASTPPTEARRLALLTERAVAGGHLPTGAELRAALDVGGQR